MYVIFAEPEEIGTIPTFPEAPGVRVIESGTFMFTPTMSTKRFAELEGIDLTTTLAGALATNFEGLVVEICPLVVKLRVTVS